MAKAPVLPTFFQGYNSSLFQTAGLVHPILRTLMLPRELLKRRGQEIRLKIGYPIPYKRLSLLNDPADLTAYLRFRTYLLKKAFIRPNGFLKLPLRKNRNIDRFEPVAPPEKKSTQKRHTLRLFRPIPSNALSVAGDWPSSGRDISTGW